MSINMVELRSQLAPGWSAVNIVLMIVLFMFSWLLGLLMIAYILWGHTVGLDLSRPETIRTAGAKILTALRAALSSFKGQSGVASGTPRPEQDSFEKWRKSESEKLDAEKEKLAQQRADFEADKKDFEARRDSNGSS